MLKGISPLIPPELLAALSAMGHGDELVLADGNFPAASVASRTVVRLPGIGVQEILDAILPLVPVDTYNGCALHMMAAVPGDTLDPAVENAYRETLDRHGNAWAPIEHIERFAFYERARSAFLIVQTGDTRKYANLMLRKGCV